MKKVLLTLVLLLYCALNLKEIAGENLHVISSQINEASYKEPVKSESTVLKSVNLTLAYDSKCLRSINYFDCDLSKDIKAYPIQKLTEKSRKVVNVENRLPAGYNAIKNSIPRTLTEDKSISLFNRTNLKSFEMANRIEDDREVTLKKFFKKYHSPLEPYAYEFIYWADYYDIDWRLVPAITGVESTFGKRIPANSYNAYGWNNGNYKFSSWPNSIEHVNKTLREKYINKNANTIDKIARRYAPPSSTWGSKVKFFMNKINDSPLPNEF